VSGLLLLNGNAERDVDLVTASAPFLRRVLGPSGERPVLLVTAAWAEREHDEAHVKQALNEVGARSRFEGGVDRGIQNLSLHHELCGVLDAAPEIARAAGDAAQAVEAARSFYLSHNAHLIALMRRALSDARKIEPSISLAGLVRTERGTAFVEGRSLLRLALHRELRHALATLEESDERMVSLLADLEDRSFDAAGTRYHPAWQAARARLEARVVEAGAVFLFGGRLDVLLRALRFFRLRDAFAEALRRGALFVAMSAGAMSLCERVIVYDDFAHEPSDFQLYDRGLGVVRDVQLFPHCMDRIQTDDPDNLSYLAHRFRHHVCVGLNQRSFLLLETSPLRATSVGAEDMVYVFDPEGRKIGVRAGEAVAL
jgi:hypothetical protein